ncbi:hypothetical protein VSU19_14005 [Verrucomicrobiales bacterium BCK34]|nr:hypothetical protein [Verrucomicrobiales bacterium BCK34]
MKRLQLLAFSLLVAASASFTSCTSINPDDEGASRGISASQTGMTREDVYEWQDRTFRQLAY